MDEQTRKSRIAEHLDAIRDIEAQAVADSQTHTWPPDQFYLLWHVVVGLTLGGLGSIVSLLANVVGAPLFGQRPLELVRVYLTFPMGERALVAEEGAVLFIGCVLYLATGAVYGILFHLAWTTYFKDASPKKKFLAATAMGLGLWIVNFYLILSWLQPMLLGGNWIVTMVPWWVGALTHLTFAWAMLAGEYWGRFDAYHGSAKKAAATGIVLTLVAALVSGCATPSSSQETPPASDETSAFEPAAVEEDEALEYPEWETVRPGEHEGYNQRATLLQRGHLVYAKYCIGCHGEFGDGNGPAAIRLITKPRDFTSGIYKFRSTDSGSLPLETDLYRTLTRGLSRVSMPAFPFMPEGDKLAVIEYIKTFYPRWDAEKFDRRIVHVPHPPGDLGEAQRIDRGLMVYLQMQCSKCHGTDGRGTGATQTEYVDAWGNTQKPFDFTRGSLKGGNAPDDIYRTFHTGLRSIMPSYAGDTLAGVIGTDYEGLTGGLDATEVEQIAAVAQEFPPTAEAIFSDMDTSDRLALAERNSWDLVAYILSLRTGQTTAAAVLGKTDG